MVNLQQRTNRLEPDSLINKIVERAVAGWCPSQHLMAERFLDRPRILFE